MQAKTKLVILMTAALVITNVAAGYAGGGGAGGPGGEVFFQCYPAVSGPNPPNAFEVNDQFIDPTVEQVGKLKMVCSFNPTVTKVGTNPPDIFVIGQEANIVTCYEAHSDKVKADVAYTDTLFADTQNARVKGPGQLICVLGVGSVTPR